MATCTSSDNPQENIDSPVENDGQSKGFSKKVIDVERYQLERAPVNQYNGQPTIGPSVEEYKMNHMYRGRVHIFNHETYRENLKLDKRLGTNVDKIVIKKSFESLNFDVIIHDDLEENEIKSTLERESRDDYYRAADCIIIVVLTHGKANSILYASNETYQADELWKNFTAVRCPALALKPKIFIIQACRGEIASQEVDVQQIQIDSPDVYKGQSYTIPEEADILVAYSTYEGRVAHRDTQEGTWFIQEMCEEFDRNGKTKDLLTLLTNVNRRVAVKKAHKHSKQMPVLQSTLTRKLFFGYNTRPQAGEITMAMEKKLDAIMTMLQTMKNEDVKKELRKPLPPTQWSSLRTRLNINDTLPDEEEIYRLSRGLQIFLEDVSQDEPVHEDGETILNFLSNWGIIDKELHIFLYNRLVKFLQMYAADWRTYFLLAIPRTVTKADNNHRRCSQSSSTSTARGDGSIPHGRRVNKSKK